MYKTTLLALLLLSALSATAQEKPKSHQNVVADTTKTKGNQLDEVVIKLNGNRPPVQIGRIAIAPMDLPQAIQVIDGSTIKEQQSLRLSDVIKNVNGVYVSSTRGGAAESFYARGYDLSANNIYKNGFRVNAGSMPEVSSLEKIEVLKGNAALLYGNVAPGGILNLITKSPHFTSGGEISFQAGSYSFYKPSIDFYGPLNQSIAYRINGSYESAESFRDVVETERFYINPSLLFKVDQKTEILLQADYLRDNWTPDFGTGSIGNKVADIPRNTYLGALWSNGLTTQATVSALIKHNINNNWKVHFNSGFQSYERASEGTERLQPQANGDVVRPLGKNLSQDQIFAQQANLQGTFFTGRVKHQLLVGADFDQTFADAFTFKFDPPVYDTINIFTIGQFPQRTDIPESQKTQVVRTKTDRFGAYFQDLISLSAEFKVLAGLRWTWQEASPETTNFIENKVTEGAKKIDQAFSPKVGLVYQPMKSMSVFASYSTSFSPNSGVTVDNDPLEPSIIDQYEAGIKKDFFDSRLSTNITVYQITNSNLAQMAEFKADGTPNTDGNIRTLSGETTSKGVELDITGQVSDGLKLMAGYSFNDMRYTKTSGLTGSFIEGSRLVRTPQHTANLSAFYTVQAGKLRGLSFGTIGNYVGERIAGWNNTNGQTIPDREIPIEGYTTIDISAGYKWNKFSVLVRLSNITNELNYNVHENYSVNPIAPRQVFTSLAYRF